MPVPSSRTLKSTVRTRLPAWIRKPRRDGMVRSQLMSLDAPAAAPLDVMSVTVIVPTYQEALNLPRLLARLEGVRKGSGLDLELLIVDDDSRDGTAEYIAEFDRAWVRLTTRTTDRGLSAAVLEGMRLSDRDFLVVMDADLSHPPEQIPELLQTLAQGADIAVGSRFVEGGTTADDWGPFRWLNSRVATLLALPLTQISDPMSGFFAMPRETFSAASNLNPVGYKILLELIVKCRCRHIVEVPIHFDNRQFGASKLSIFEQLKYFRHLRRLYMYRYGTWSHFAQFLVVGVSGLVVNLAVLTALLRLPIGAKSAVPAAIAASMLWNFALNRRFSFSYARTEPLLRQLGKYVAACSIGGLVNYWTTLSLLQFAHNSQTAAMAGVCAGTAFNFVSSRYLVFRSRHVKRKPPGSDNTGVAVQDR